MNSVRAAKWNTLLQEVPPHSWVLVAQAWALSDTLKVLDSAPPITCDQEPGDKSPLHTVVWGVIFKAKWWGKEKEIKKLLLSGTLSFIRDNLQVLIWVLILY